MVVSGFNLILSGEVKKKIEEIAVSFVILMKKKNLEYFSLHMLFLKLISFNNIFIEFESSVELNCIHLFHNFPSYVINNKAKSIISLL